MFAEKLNKALFAGSSAQTQNPVQEGIAPWINKSRRYQFDAGAYQCAAT